MSKPLFSLQELERLYSIMKWYVPIAGQYCKTEEDREELDTILYKIEKAKNEQNRR